MLLLHNNKVLVQKYTNIIQEIYLKAEKVLHFLMTNGRLSYRIAVVFLTDLTFVFGRIISDSDSDLKDIVG